MFGRIIPLIGLTLLSAAFTVLVASAADPQMIEGTVVSAAAGKIAIKDKAGKDQSFTIDAATRITVNGKPGRLEDLKETTRVQVMIDGQGKVLSVATIDKEK